MARAKKASRKRYRRFNYSRWYRRRRYRRRYPKRSGRRFPKNTEVKSCSKYFSGVVNVSVPEAEGYTSDITYTPGCCFIVGSGDVGLYELNIPQGTGQGQRVGNKIEPIKLRVSGTFSLENSKVIVGNNTYSPNFWQVRCLVYQVRGANAEYECDDPKFHQLAMETLDGYLKPSQLRKLLADFFNDGNATNDLNYFSEEHWRRNNMIGKSPLRRGIGGLLRVLYKKTFWINSQKTPIKQFRFITKTPKRLVYSENTTRGAGDGSFIRPNNPIYIVWMFQPGSFSPDSVPKLNISYNVDLFFTDK